MPLFVESNPELVSEWCWEKNGDIDIHRVAQGSHKKAWWKCSKGHTWEAVIGNRARLGGVCGECVCPVLRAYDSSGFHQTTCTVIIWKKPFATEGCFYV